MEIEALEKTVERGKALERLLDNNDFKELFLDSYLDEDLKGLTRTLAMSRGERREFIQEELMARGRFGLYLENIANDGVGAVATINEISKRREEALGNDE